MGDRCNYQPLFFTSEKQKQLQAEPVYSRVSKIKRLSHSLEDMVRSETADSVTTYPSDEQLLCDGLTEESGSTRTNPCYQSDDSKLASTHPHEYRCVMQEGEHMMYEDKCGTHEGSLTSGDKDVTCEAGYATIKENRASEQGITPLSPDPLDETASTGDPNAPRPPDKAALRSQKRHKDNGSVQLLSVRGVSDLPEGSSLYFPVGASADMVSIHYAAATGNKGALEGFLSSLPVLQDPVEMVLGSDKLCRLEGVDVGDSEGRTPLMHAAHGNHLQCVQLLVGVGASVNTTAKGEGAPDWFVITWSTALIFIVHPPPLSPHLLDYTLTTSIPSFFITPSPTPPLIPTSPLHPLLPSLFITPSPTPSLIPSSHPHPLLPSSLHHTLIHSFPIHPPPPGHR